MESAGGQPPMAQMNQMKSKKKMMMHMTFYWGNNALILFKGFPGRSASLYFLSLFFVFCMSLLVEFLSALARRVSNNSLVQTSVYVFRVGLAYLVMLAVMSFNVGVLLVAVLGHGIGFLVFSRYLFNCKSKCHHTSGEEIGMTC